MVWLHPDFTLKFPGASPHLPPCGRGAAATCDGDQWSGTAGLALEPPSANATGAGAIQVPKSAGVPSSRVERVLA